MAAVANVDERTAVFLRVLQNVIGFANANDRNLIVQGGITMLDDLSMVKEKGLRDMIESFEKRTADNGRVSFGLARANRMYGLLCYVHDCDRVNEQYDEDSITVLTLNQHIQYAEVRKGMSEHEAIHVKTASPGPFKEEKNWIPWHSQMEMFLSGLIGIAGIPLTYVIRTNEEGDYANEYDNFIDEQVARAPLFGANFQADARMVHNHILSFIGGNNAEQWVKDLKRHNNGRRDMIALRLHYSGAGNVQHQVSRADKMRDSLHYKSERMLSFEKFLVRCKEMFNIYEDQAEPMNERQKVQFLIGKNKIQAPQLQHCVAALMIEFHRRTGTANPLTFVDAANQLSAIVGITNDNTRGISAVKQGGGKYEGKKPHKKTGPKPKHNSPNDNAAGPIDPVLGPLGFRKDFKKLTPEHQQKIRDARDRLGLPGGNRRVSAAATIIAPSAASITNSIAGLSLDQLADALSHRMVSASRSGVSVASEITEVETRAGVAFGGRAEAARRRAP
jgi:hypothetical protein